MENEYVRLIPAEKGKLIIIEKASGGEAGWISFDPAAYRISFFISEEKRGRHLAANAVYLAVPYFHETYQVSRIVCFPGGSDEAKHVLEHNGFERISGDGEPLIFMHEMRRLSPEEDEDGENVIYFAGGCFWGMEKVFKVLNGVTQTTVGYANGRVPSPTYEMVCRMNDGYRETVRVKYDPDVITPEVLLKAFFLCADPEQEDGQGNDVGEQYMTGVYYRSGKLGRRLEKFFAEERQKHPVFYTELKKLECFYEAEEYHQNYLEKNPGGYCHIRTADLEKVKKLNQM